MDTYPYRLINKSELALIEDVFAPVFSAWEMEWGFEGKAKLNAGTYASLMDSPTMSDYLGVWLQAENNDGSWLAVKMDQMDVRGAFLLTTDCSFDCINKSSIISDISRSMLSRLLLHLFMLSTGEPGPVSEDRLIAVLPEYISRPGAGAVWLNYQLGTSAIDLVLSPEIVAGLLEQSTERTVVQEPLTTRTLAIKNEIVSLEVLLGSAEITLGDIGSISVGDVLRINTKVGDKLDVVLSGRKISQCQLGYCNQYKAAVFGPAK